MTETDKKRQIRKEETEETTRENPEEKDTRSKKKKERQKENKNEDTETDLDQPKMKESDSDQPKKKETVYHSKSDPDQLKRKDNTPKENMQKDNRSKKYGESKSTEIEVKIKSKEDWQKDKRSKKYGETDLNTCIQTEARTYVNTCVIPNCEIYSTRDVREKTASCTASDQKSTDSRFHVEKKSKIRADKKITSFLVPSRNSEVNIKSVEMSTARCLNTSMKPTKKLSISSQISRKTTRISYSKNLISNYFKIGDKPTINLLGPPELTPPEKQTLALS